MTLIEWMIKRGATGTGTTPWLGTLLTPCEMTDEQMHMLRIELLMLDDFADTKELNFMSGPMVLAGEDGCPLTDYNVTYCGGPTRSIEAWTYQHGRSDIPGPVRKFGRAVDLYSVQLTEKIYPPVKVEDLGPGVWMLPQAGDFKRTLVMRWDPQVMQDLSQMSTMSAESVMRNMRDKAAELMVSDRPNTPGAFHGLMVRVSGRSFQA